MQAKTEPTTLKIQSQQRALIPDACGDLVFEVQTDRATRVALVDACGHGPEAARIARQFETLVRDHLARPISRSVIRRWNHELLGILPVAKFVAVTIVEIEHDTQAVRIWNAANPAPLLLASDTGRIERMEGAGMPLGIVPVDAFLPPVPQVVEMGAGDDLLMFSDGVVDQADAPRHGEHERWDEWVSAAFGSDEDTMSSLWRSVTERLDSAEQVDDLTAVRLAHVPTKVDSNGNAVVDC